ncbi:MAG: cysteine--tRNA ligase [Bdellovibrionales bacterium RIFCSPHIGHO2_01_FULL_40_29]|nr:MAG: cysteine--tRNA ligase [Bdellovibrionales bacterium RIFCSPHIGHO2_01_FULL_40_29]OFZ32628.1 MAG: cysteine--tRNA ligase [Bdellovibrionales bacterium RIFCSPHIGHO2_02_FULL_40_15]
MLKIYNTLGKKLEEFKPIKPGQVSIYVCGPTVYDYLHVGNFRGPVFFNFVKNWLEHIGYKVEYALNFTDVEDKIINRAVVEKKTAKEISEFYIQEYKKDFLSLGLTPHDYNPKVTDHMPEIIQMISQLIENKKAYVTSGVGQAQDVNYSISDFKDYGKLSGRKPEELQSGVRIEVDEKKKNPLDFALWKSAKSEEANWPSPWGAGRPGWHIECSAMIHALFGNQIDIHGGGLDLMFPHHENEIAQSEGCTGETFVKYWMHWNMIQFNGAKMSKSIGNIISLRDFLKDQHPEIYKWMMLTVHYRSTAEFGVEAIDRAISGLARVYSALAMAETVLATCTGEAKKDEKFETELTLAWQKIMEAFNDDFGTPAGFAVMFDVIRGFNAKNKRGMKPIPTTQSQCEQFIAFIKTFGRLLSLFQQPASDFLTSLDNQLLKKSGVSRDLVDQLVQERAAARLAKDFARSDELRKKLTDMNIAVSDLPTGSFWEVVK